MASKLGDAAMKSIDEFEVSFGKNSKAGSAGTDHSNLFLFLIVLLVVLVQVIAFFWKRKNYKSYQVATMGALWIIPFYISFRCQFWAFCGIWCVVSSFFGYYLHIASRASLSQMTPRRVYKFFKLCSNVTFLLVFCGYSLMIFSMIADLKHPVVYEVSLLTIYYGLYYGVLGRDLIDLISGEMARSIGYHSGDETMPIRGLRADTCAICGGITGTDPKSPPFVLNCSHTFHNSCIRGWSIIGKKETCPYCKERIDLMAFRENPWQQQEYLYGRFLDFVRYLILWLPIPMLAVYIVKIIMNK